MSHWTSATSRNVLYPTLDLWSLISLLCWRCWILKWNVTITAGKEQSSEVQSHKCVSGCVCSSCMMLPRLQVLTGICHAGSAQLHSPHYPLWTRTDVISLSLSLSTLTSSPSPLFTSICLTLASSISPVFYFIFFTFLSTWILFYFCPVFFFCCPTLTPHSLSLSPTILHSLSILCLWID